MRWLNGLLTFLLIVMVIVAGGVVWFAHQVDRQGPLAELKTITIPAGRGVRAIADQLETDGLVTSRHVFLAHHLMHSIWQRLQGRVPGSLKAGVYEIKAGASMRQIASTIRSGKAILQSVSVPEGLTSYQIVQRLRANTNLAGEITQIPPEGFLMPDTYRVPRGAARSEVLELMAEEQRKFLREAWTTRQPGLPYKDVSEALILASLIEKETGPKDDPARIAGVFINRLRKGMRLQSDPTILYGKFGTRVSWGSTIYRSDIKKKTSHNTYQIDGLPPTPICNPGRASIKAALNPAQTKDLYFVANGQGGHFFSETVKEHNRAVARWRKIEKELIAARKEREAKASLAKSSSAVVTVTRLNASSKAPVSGAETAKSDDSTQVEYRTSTGIPLPVRRPVE